MGTLDSLEVPKELVTVNKVLSETHVTIALSWREIKALCLKSRKLETLLLQSQPLSRLRPLTADKQADELVKAARSEIGNNSTGKRVPFWDLPESSSFKEILSSGFSEFQGICFGEMHDQPKTFLIDHLKHMKTCGVEILFLEHLLYDTMQVFLDKYFQDDADAEMPIPLAAYLKSLDEGFELEETEHNFTALVKAAKAQGIRVVGIDTSLSYEAGHDMFGSGGVNRYLAMNHVAKKIIDWEAGVFTKYAAFMGYFHGATASACGKGISISDENSVPGVDEMLEVPFIIIESNEENVNAIEQNVSNYKDSISFVNMVISGYQSSD